MKVNGQMLNCKIDTGVQCNVISENMFRVLKLQKLEKSRSKLVSYSGHNIKTRGKISVVGEYKGKLFPLSFFVVEGDAPAVLGKDACEKELKVIKRVYGIE